MKFTPLLALVCTPFACVSPSSPPVPGPTTSPAQVDANTLQSLHVRLTVDPADGHVTYLGGYDGQRNLLGDGGITAAIVGIEPPDLTGELTRPAPDTLLYTGTDKNGILWAKQYRLTDNTVAVTYKITSHRDQAFDAILYSLADLPDATVTGDNRNQYIRSPHTHAHFRAVIDDPDFPGELFNSYALRSDSRRLQPGESMEFHLSWELKPVVRRAAP